MESDNEISVMASIMTCAGCPLGLRFIFAGGSVLKEWGIEATAGSLVVLAELARFISASPSCSSSDERLPPRTSARRRVWSRAERSRCSRLSGSSSSRLDESALASSARSLGRRCSRQASSGCGGAGDDRTEAKDPRPVGALAAAWPRPARSSPGGIGVPRWWRSPGLPGCGRAPRRLPHRAKGGHFWRSRPRVISR